MFQDNHPTLTNLIVYFHFFKTAFVGALTKRFSKLLPIGPLSGDPLFQPSCIFNHRSRAAGSVVFYA